MDPQLIALAVGGVIGGMALLVRGFAGYREAARISDTSSSRISSIAVGEVLVSGVVEPAELTLVSPLQSAPCVFIGRDRRDGRPATRRPRSAKRAAVGFRVRDDSGELRVFPRGARFDVPAASRNGLRTSGRRRPDSACERARRSDRARTGRPKIAALLQ